MARIKRIEKAKQAKPGVAQSLLDLIIGSTPDLGMASVFQRFSSSASSWFENPRLLEAHHQKRRARTRVRKQLRRARRARGQNPRTGAPK